MAVPQNVSLQDFPWGAHTTHQLKLEWHYSEIQNLYQRPDHVIRLQYGNVDFPKFVFDGLQRLPFGKGHEGEE